MDGEVCQIFLLTYTSAAHRESETDSNKINYFKRWCQVKVPLTLESGHAGGVRGIKYFVTFGYWKINFGTVVPSELNSR